jgi:cardiolipin synthase
VRVFEWNGTMLHAKTAVADSRWARVGSSNLNLASFVGNYELDVAVEDAGFAALMEAQYRDDLGRSTEIILQQHRRSRRPVPSQPEADGPRRAPSGSAGRAAAGAVRFGSTIGTAIMHPGALGFGDRRILGGAAAALSALAVVGAFWPRIVAWPLAAIALWFAIAFLIRAARGARDARRAPKAGS